LQSLENLKRSLFWIVARTCFTLYRWFPVFGFLRASIGIIHRNGEFLIIERNDGRGFSFPGGISSWKEAPEETLRREVAEETGMTVTALEFCTRYRSTADVPCDISVFAVQATGEPGNSWEGLPRWMAPSEIEPRLVESQRPVLELLARMSAATPF
jgi:8-oxo-dGTP pyrophosphatase MutT (NUDIX family)